MAPLKYKVGAHYAFWYACSGCALLCVYAMVCEQFKNAALTVERGTCEVERKEALLGQQPRLSSIPLLSLLYAWIRVKILAMDIPP